MPKKSSANRARAGNLRKWKALGTKATVEFEEDESVNSLAHACPSGPDTSPCRHDDDPERVLECLDNIPLLQIRRLVISSYLLEYYANLKYRYANRSARFMDAYLKGLTGTDAIWANRKYHGHRTLPASILAEVKKANYKS
jgi:hypothetical protein